MAESRWDWYQMSLRGVQPETIWAYLQRCYELSHWEPCRAKNGYENGARLSRGDRRLAEMWWGGNPGVHVLASGEDAPALASALRVLRFEKLVTRADACLDWVEPGLFDEMASGLIEYAKKAKIKIDQQGDWVRGKGRTLYLGSRQSACQLVLYEKGYESGGDPFWVRLEARVYPKGDAARKAVAKWDPGETFGAGWIAEASLAVGVADLKRRAVGAVWRPSDVQRARAAMLRQYGQVLASWADETGSWGELGPVMERELFEMSERKKAEVRASESPRSAMRAEGACQSAAIQRDDVVVF